MKDPHESTGLAPLLSYLTKKTARAKRRRHLVYYILFIKYSSCNATNLEHRVIPETDISEIPEQLGPPAIRR